MTNHCALVRSRSTVPLTGTSTKPQALLDHAATISLAYATRLVSKELALTVPASGITRRALVLYAQQLERMQPDQLRQEAFTVRNGCKALPVPNEVTQAALAQLDSDTFPGLAKTINAHQPPIDWDAFHDRVDALVATIPTRTRSSGKQP
jgi:hypothetical protein